MPRKSNRRTRARRGPSNYRLPDSTIIKVRAITRQDMNPPASLAVKQVTMLDLTPDINSSSARTINFQHYKVVLTPPTSPFALNLANAFTAQIFATTIAGVQMPISKAIVLSMVNPRQIRFRVPDWLIGPQPAGTSGFLFQIVWRMSNGAGALTSAISFGAEIEATGQISNPEIVTF